MFAKPSKPAKMICTCYSVTSIAGSGFCRITKIGYNSVQLHITLYGACMWMHGKVHTTGDITLKGAYAWVILKRKEE